MREFIDEEKGEPVKGKWLADSKAEAVLQALASQARIFVELCHGRGRAGPARRPRSHAFKGNPATQFSSTSRTKPRPAVAALFGKRSPRKVCWDAKLHLLSQGNPIRGETPDDVMPEWLSLTAPNVGDYSLKHWALDQLHVSLAEEKSNKQASLLLEPEKMADGLCRQLERCAGSTKY